MNATLQSTGNDPNLEFSVAMYVEIPSTVVEEDDLRAYLEGIFRGIVRDNPGLHVEIEIGPEGVGEEKG